MEMLTEQKQAVDQPKLKKQEPIPKQLKRFPYYRKGIGGGLIAGAGMGLYLFIIEALFGEPSMAVKFSKYFILAAVLGYFLVQTRKQTRDRLFFKRGALLGLLISVVSAITLIAINSFAVLVGSEIAFDKFNVDSSTIGNSLLVDGVLFFEIIVYGMILSFIWLQYLKGYTEGSAENSELNRK